jgi:hypothetical protein
MSLMTSFHSKKRDHNSAILIPFFSRSASKLSGDYVNHGFMQRLAAHRVGQRSLRNERGIGGEEFASRIETQRVRKPITRSNSLPNGGRMASVRLNLPAQICLSHGSES